MEKLINKAQGCLLGAAIGDALGMPTECISLEELRIRYNGQVTSFQPPSPHHPCGHLRAGQYTDDTQQLILLAQSLTERKGFDLHDFGHKLGEWAYRCQSVPGYDRFAGSTSLTAGMELYREEDPRTTGKLGATCGSAMRTAPLGLFYAQRLQELPAIAAQASSITHAHPAAKDSAVFISTLIAYLTNQEPLEEALQKARSHVSSNLGERLDLALASREKNPTDAALLIGTSQSCYETVPMALYCFLHSPEDYEQTVIAAANLVPGDTDSIACITGALAGAYNGVQAIPPRFKKEIEDRELLEELGQKIIEVAHEH